MALIKATKGERVRLRGTAKTGVVEGIDWHRMLCVKVLFNGGWLAESVPVERLEPIEVVELPESMRSKS